MNLPEKLIDEIKFPKRKAFLKVCEFKMVKNVHHQEEQTTTLVEKCNKQLN